MAQLWFKFWAKEYLADGKVRCLTYEQRGILQTLWAFAWEEGSIPSDETTLGTMLGLPAKAMRTHMQWVNRFFHPSIEDASRLISPRLELDRSEADAKGSKARESALIRWSKVNANAYANASKPDMPLECEHPCVDHAGQGQGQKVTTPTPSGVAPKGARRKRRTSGEILGAFSPEVVQVVNTLASEWREQDPEDGRPITVGIEDFGKAIRRILQSQPNVTPEILTQAGRDYLASTRQRYKAPQYFFGPEGPWDGFVMAILTAQTSQEVAVAS